MLSRRGYYARRIAGSHGCYDVVATNEHEIRLIQIKSGASARHTPEARAAFAAIPAPKNAKKELWHFSGKRNAPPLIAEL